MLLPWRTGIVEKFENLTAHTRRFWIRVPEPESFDYKAGQFVTFDLPIHDRPNKRLRSYSIANAADGSNSFELLIVQLPDGAGSKYLFEEIQIGSELKFRGPQGVFLLHQPIIKPIYFICTGTGVAPFRAMLQEIRQKGLEHQELHLIFGTRTQGDLLYRAEFEKMQQEWPSFHYHPVLSREEWSGKKGYVHEVYEELIAQSENKEASFYLCGWKNMIDEARTKLAALGYDKKDIHFEIYG